MRAVPGSLPPGTVRGRNPDVWPPETPWIFGIAVRATAVNVGQALSVRQPFGIAVPTVPTAAMPTNRRGWQLSSCGPIVAVLD